MDQATYNLINNADVKPALSKATLNDWINKIPFKLPDDYLNFFEHCNGCEGFIHDNIYVNFWGIDELIKNTEMYAVDEYAPELFLIGSNGGGAAYGIVKEDGRFIQVPFIGMSLDESEFLGNDFSTFIWKLVQ